MSHRVPLACDDAWCPKDMSSAFRLKLVSFLQAGRTDDFSLAPPLGLRATTTFVTVTPRTMPVEMPPITYPVVWHWLSAL
jgi:hypothetical protein